LRETGSFAVRRVRQCPVLIGLVATSSCGFTFISGLASWKISADLFFDLLIKLHKESSKAGGAFARR
jgi:hypothetical protein